MRENNTSETSGDEYCHLVKIKRGRVIATAICGQSVAKGYLDQGYEYDWPYTVEVRSRHHTETIQRLVTERDTIDQQNKSLKKDVNKYIQNWIRDHELAEALKKRMRELETEVLDVAISDKLDETGSPLTWEERAVAAEALFVAIEGTAQVNIRVAKEAEARIAELRMALAEALPAIQECRMTGWGKDFVADAERLLEEEASQ